jgi:hypothetical protein
MSTGKVMAAVMVVAGAMVQPSALAQAPAANPFDGRCFPAGNYSPGALDIKGGRFVYSSQGRQGARQSCPIQIQPDGTFNNQKCDVPTSGRIVGDMMEMHTVLPDGSATCDKTYKRAKP